ncbi:hypothetical protein AN641_01115 [Candidatus Epulonipiscioides gigas]|nr:hypothetical protein AN641_01115 [Epulopiscium sp. SCG-C07WGA-EpuloA2]
MIYEDIHPKTEAYCNLIKHKEIFFELLTSFVPEKWSQEIKLENIEDGKISILKDFDDQKIDTVLYKVNFNDKKMYFYVLPELYSKNDAHSEMSVRLLNFTTQIWPQILKKKEKVNNRSFEIPKLIPIIIYNNLVKLGNNFEVEENIAEPTFKHVLINVNKYKKEELIELNNTISAIFLLAQDVGYSEYFDRVKIIDNKFTRLKKSHKLWIENWLK